jgi:hypothetical protein
MPLLSAAENRRIWASLLPIEQAVRRVRRAPYSNRSLSMPVYDFRGGYVATFKNTPTAEGVKVRWTSLRSFNRFCRKHKIPCVALLIESPSTGCPPRAP